MNFTTSQRGFRHGKFHDTYGCECSISESSAAGYNAIWFGMDRDNEGNAFKHVDGHPLGARMHLSQDQIKELLPILQFFAENGYLPRNSDEIPEAGEPLPFDDIPYYDVDKQGD